MSRLMAFTAWSAALLAWAAGAQQPSASAAQQQEHLRGDVVALEGDTVEVKSRSGEMVKFTLAADAQVSLVAKADLASVTSGAFVGTTAVPQSDGTLRAIEVHVFPDSMRGTGEGHRPWDLQPGSTMTNATVAKLDERGGKARSGGTGSTMTNATVARVGEGGGGARQLSLKYRGGEKTIIVPPGAPVVKMEKGDRSNLVPGAHVFAFLSREPDGTLVAERLNVGKDGLVPPM